MEFATEGHETVIDGLKQLYRNVLSPIEAATKFDIFYSSLLTDAEFDAAPMVLLIGPYSVGKTSFIKHIIGREFPGIRIGPEPTTDRFMAIIHGNDDKTVPGNALTVAPGSPFGGLKYYGNNFLTRFEGSCVASPILERLTLVDTPGVLSGEKQRLARNYDFDQIVKWFAERVDMIILLFDPFKLDVSDELAAIIRNLAGNEDKIRVVLNKADQISQQQLMRVYGALMWSLGKVIETPEVTRVYIGSFWEQPMQNAETAELLHAEMRDLMADLRALPAQAAVRKINELVKRMRLLKAHAYLTDHLRREMPSMFGKEKKKANLLANLPDAFRTVCKVRGLPPGDFPDITKFKNIASELDFAEFPKVDGNRLKRGKLLEQLEHAMSVTIPELMRRLPSQNNGKMQAPAENPRDEGWGPDG